ncbi:MAG: HTH domain-containing protein [Pseudomonadales bacterium]|nr:HTH domain-containing protein [Pseudomonadales bacterium]NRA14527.1 HTH domain-containing protein [Oceanospirillaceae bacterium]
MARKTNRILAVPELLQNYGGLSGAELSARLGLDCRTLWRYIVALEYLGIPIMSERVRYGSYTLVSGFKLQPMMFDEDEAMALVTQPDLQAVGLRLAMATVGQLQTLSLLVSIAFYVISFIYTFKFIHLRSSEKKSS